MRRWRRHKRRNQRATSSSESISGRIRSPTRFPTRTIGRATAAGLRRWFRIIGRAAKTDRIGEPTKTSHAYTTTGKYTITLTTHYTGTYTVNNGPTLPIPGQGNIPSPPLHLTVWRAITRNYAENCNQNPTGTGC